MKPLENIVNKIKTLGEVTEIVKQLKNSDKKVAFTNGCFDILHPGHISSLSQAASTADFLIVGLNSDLSVKRLKGEGRPINDQDSRALMLAALSMVDAIVVFEEDTPLELIKQVLPDVLVKGGDYTEDQIAGAREVKEAGGKVVINPIVDGFSTTFLIQKLRSNSR
ncbi:MAG TPA: D-glycero-beta-D-manno-heptose 1-phosphate adenylyltransferase [Flavisolibacter sp.]|nr:D-glycero-beta-D-manno-heptose 1-phosphate adenylyltransferase [Flavisolibacter sp.]